jgi:FolB domain-containing protein
MISKIKKVIMKHSQGIISIENFKFNTIIGIYEEERIQVQKICVDIEIELDFKKIEEKDKKITVGVDYTQLVAFVKNYIIEKKFKLLEDCLLSTGEAIMNEWEPINELNLSVSKPKANPKAENTKASMRFSR